MSRINSRILLLRTPRFIALLLVLGVALPTSADEAVWCPKPTGLVERNATYRSSSATRKLAESLAGSGVPFLYVCRTPVEAQVRALAGKMAPLVLPPEKVSSLSADDLEKLLDSPQLAASLKTLMTAAKQTMPEPHWYFYSNSASFQEHFKKQSFSADTSTGALLLFDAPGERKHLANAIRTMAQASEARFVLIETDADLDLKQARCPTVSADACWRPGEKA